VVTAGLGGRATLQRVEQPIATRSTPAAVLLTFLILVAAAVILSVVVLLTDAVAGGLPATVAGIAAEIAILTFATLRAYPPGAKIPWAWFIVLTVLLTVLLPLIYLSWLWATRKKWREARESPDR